MEPAFRKEIEMQPSRRPIGQPQSHAAIYHPQHSSFQSTTLPLSIPPPSIDLNSDFSNSQLSDNYHQYTNNQQQQQQQQHGEEDELDQDSSQIEYTNSVPLTKEQREMRWKAGYPDRRANVGMSSAGQGQYRRERQEFANGGGGSEDRNLRGNVGQSHHQHQHHQQDFDSFHSQDEDEEVEDLDEPSYDPGVARATRATTNSIGGHQTNFSLLNQSNRINKNGSFAGKGEKLGGNASKPSNTTNTNPSLLRRAPQQQQDLEIDSNFNSSNPDSQDSEQESSIMSSEEEEIQTSSQKGKSKSKGNGNHPYGSNHRGELSNRDSTGAHEVFVATPFGSIGPSQRQGREREKVGGNRQRPKFRNHDITMDFSRTEELMKKLEGNGGEVQRDEEMEKRERGEFPRSSSNLIPPPQTSRSNYRQPTTSHQAQPSQETPSENQGSFTTMMKSVRKDFTSSRRGESEPVFRSGREEEYQAGNEEEAEGSGSGFGPGSQHSSNKTKVDEEDSMFFSSGLKTHFRRGEGEVEKERTRYGDLLLPSGQNVGRGKPLNKETYLPDLTGITDCLESPAKEKLGIKHREIDLNPVATLSSPGQAFSFARPSHQRVSSQSSQPQKQERSSSPLTINSSNSRASSSTSKHLQNRAKEFRDLIEILRNMKEQLEDTDLRVEELEECRMDWEERFMELSEGIRRQLGQLGLKQEGAAVCSDSENVGDEESREVDGEDGDETFTEETQRQERVREDKNELNQNVERLSRDLEASLDLLKEMEIENGKKNQVKGQTKPRSAVQTNSNLQPPAQSQHGRSKNAPYRSLYLSASEDEESEDLQESEEEEEIRAGRPRQAKNSTNHHSGENDDTQAQLSKIKRQMKIFEREIGELNHVVFVELMNKREEEAIEVDVRGRELGKGSKNSVPASRSSSKNKTKTASKSQPQSRSNSRPQSRAGPSDMYLGEVSIPEMDRAFVRRPNSSATASAITEALDRKASKKSTRSRFAESYGGDVPSSPFRRSTGSSTSSASDTSSIFGGSETGEVVRRARRRVVSYEDEANGDGDETRSNSHIGPGRQEIIDNHKRNGNLGAGSSYIQSSPIKGGRHGKTASNFNSRSGANAKEKLVFQVPTQAQFQPQTHAEVSNSLLTPPHSPRFMVQDLEASESEEEEEFEDQDLTREATERVEKAFANTQQSQKNRKIRNHHEGIEHDAKSCSTCSREKKSEKKRKARMERVREFEENKLREDEEEERILNLLIIKEQEEEEARKVNNSNKSKGKARSTSNASNFNLNRHQIVLLKKIIDEHLDEFLHQRELYCQLADEFKTIDPGMSKTKRRIFAIHLLDSVESLEFKANRINQLESLLESSRSEEDEDDEDEFDFLNQSDKEQPSEKSKKNSGKGKPSERTRVGSVRNNSPPVNDSNEDDEVPYNQRTKRARSTAV